MRPFNLTHTDDFKRKGMAHIMEEVGLVLYYGGQFINQRLPTKNYLEPLSKFKGGYNGFGYIFSRSYVDLMLVL